MTGSLGLTMTTAGLASGSVAPAPKQDAYRRLALAIKASLPAQTLEDVLQDGDQRGWSTGQPPTRTTLQAAISKDFRANDTYLINKVRMSRTEIVWLAAQHREVF